MSARLKRLEGMVREMMDSEGAAPGTQASTGAGAGLANGTATGPDVQGHVVHSKKGATYVGATHCMAMLEDVRIHIGVCDDHKELGLTVGRLRT